MSKKRTKVRTSCEVQTGSKLATRCAAKWTEPAPERVFAIRVMTTKRGKPRKRKAWVPHKKDGGSYYYWIHDGLSLVEAIRGYWPHTFYKKAPTRWTVERAEAALGCKCVIVEIELRERINEKTML